MQGTEIRKALSQYHTSPWSVVVQRLLYIHIHAILCNKQSAVTLQGTYLTRVAVNEGFEEVGNHFANATQVNFRSLEELGQYIH